MLSYRIRRYIYNIIIIEFLYICIYICLNDFYLCLQVYIKYDEQYPMSEWRFELRVRYSPDDMEDLYEKDRFTYFFYYDQVRISIIFFQTYLFFNTTHQFLG